MISTQDRYRGCLMGLAAGDAVGTAVEFEPPGTFPPVTGMAGGGPFGLEPGQWTDDTSMALCLADSLVAQGGFDPSDQMDRYLRWMEDGYLSSNGGCFDVGMTVADALGRYRNTGDPWAGSTDRYSAGNGSLMRLAAVPLFFARDPAAAVRMSGESSRTTHGTAACIDACRYCGGLIVGAVMGGEQGGSPGAALFPGGGAVGTGAPVPRDRRGGGRFLRGPAASRDRGQRVRGQVPGGCPLGLPPFGQFRGGVPAGGEPGGRCRHHRRHLRSAGRRILRHRRHPPGMARRYRPG